MTTTGRTNANVNDAARAYADRLHANQADRSRTDREAQAEAYQAYVADAPAFHMVELPDNRGYCISQGIHDEIRVDGRKYKASITFLPHRKVQGGPLEEGPHAWLNQQASVLSAHPMPVGDVIEARLGDVLILAGTLWRVERTPRASVFSSDYLRLVRVGVELV